MNIELRGNLQAALDRAHEACLDMSPVYDGIGEHMMYSIDKNFYESGRPTKWKGLAASTLMGRLDKRMRRAKTKKAIAKATEHARGLKPLIRSGRLKDSITYEPDASQVTMGTNVVYAAAHNYSWKHIPARPYLVFQDQDWEKMASIVDEHILGALR